MCFDHNRNQNTCALINFGFLMLHKMISSPFSFKSNLDFHESISVNRSRVWENVAQSEVLLHNSDETQRKLGFSRRKQSSQELSYQSSSRDFSDSSLEVKAESIFHIINIKPKEFFKVFNDIPPITRKYSFSINSLIFLLSELLITFLSMRVNYIFRIEIWTIFLWFWRVWAMLIDLKCWLTNFDYTRVKCFGGKYHQRNVWN